MSVSNRLEVAPYLLVVVDFAISCLAALAVMPVGAVQIAAPVVVLLVVYAGGEYSLLAEFQVRRRLGVPLACFLFMLVALLAGSLPQSLWLIAWEWRIRVGVALAGCVVFAVAHYTMEGFLRTSSQRCVLHFRADMDEAAEALGRHIGRSRYPAIIVLDAPLDGVPDRLPADIVDPRADFPDEAARVAAVFDPARFCDVALRVLPPAVLAVRRTYVHWEEHARRAYDVLKRFFDVFAAVLLLLLSSPLMAFAALGILATDGKPALFRQARVGRYGKRFRLHKFRTLRDEPPVIGTPNDTIEQRVFRFGILLRQTRLDELPQLFNVIKGDMSLIGPRPEMEFFHERCVTTIPFYRKRLIVRPGLSGWAQVRFPHTTGETEYWDKTAYDLWYIAHRNILVDARIALRTIGVMLFGFGAR